jgi:antitoxin VapB
MGMNIKNEETHQLAKKLAALTGQNITAAITEAIRVRLTSIQNSRKDKLSDRLLVIGKSCAAHLKKDFKHVEHGDLLYDDKGLPK